MNDTLGRDDLLRMQKEGWAFPERGWVKVGNGYMTATSSRCYDR